MAAAAAAAAATELYNIVCVWKEPFLELGR